MESKNLPLKFSTVVLFVVASLWSIYGGNGLKLGHDLAGGHSLTFEIFTNRADVDRLAADVEALRKEYRETADPGKREEVQKRIERAQRELKELKESPQDTGRVRDDLLAVLKDRVDPYNLASLQWRPVGRSRFEVRMPAARPESARAKAVYREIMDRIGDGNLKPTSLRQVVQAQGKARADFIGAISRGDAERKENLERMCQAADAARESEAQGRTQDAKDARADEKRYRGKLLAGNIPLQELQNVLANYLSRAERAALKKTAEGREQVLAREKAYREDFEAILRRHPARAQQLLDAQQAYETWAQVRQALDDPADLRRLITKAGVLEFRIAPYDPDLTKEFAIDSAERDLYVDLLEKAGPEGARKRHGRFLWFPIKGKPSDFSGLVVRKYKARHYVLLYNQDDFAMLRQRGKGGWRLTRAERDTDDLGALAVGFGLDPAGAKLMARLTRANQTHCMAILLDDVAYSAPRIKEDAVISDRGIITGVPVDEVDDLIKVMRAGSLPARLNPQPVAETSFGASIGEENKKLGIRAAYAGMIAVAVFMLAYYLLAGLLADVALLLNIIFVLGTMSLLDTTFTLPGIAGIILTIGIAVDANVLIFERLREEQSKPQSVRMAVKNAYERAFSAIFDANITTLITCLILGWIGTPEVRGFAVTLGLGVAISLFTALLVTRWAFLLLLDLRVIKQPVFMLQILKVPKIDWIGKRRIFWGVSGAMVVLGVASLVWQGKRIWGIQFVAGTKAIIQFRDDGLVRDYQSGQVELPNDLRVRQLFSQTANRLRRQPADTDEARRHQRELGELADTASVEKIIVPGRAAKFLEAHDVVMKDGKPGQDRLITAADWKAQDLGDAALRKLLDACDDDKDQALTRAELEKGLPSNSYQIIATKTGVPVLREVLREAFGASLVERTRIDHQLLKGVREPMLGVWSAADGKTEVDSRLLDDVASAYREEFEDSLPGYLFVFDTSRAVRPADLTGRIHEVRMLPDFAGQEFSDTRVLGVVPAEGGFTRVAVLVSSPESAGLADAEARKDFATRELDLVTQALEREEAMVVTNFDPEIAGEAANRAIVAVVLSWLAIVVYLWFRFGSAQWGLAAVICLIHDVIIVVGLLAVSGWVHNTFVGRLLAIDSFKIDLPMVAAILTVIGYSVNDTIVVFDRIRENRGKLTGVSAAVINRSINQTLSRTLLTSGTTFIVVFIMYVWGGPGIHSFNYALLAGIVFGTYSSVAVASPLLLGFKKALLARLTTPAE